MNSRSKKYHESRKLRNSSNEKPSANDTRSESAKPVKQPEGIRSHPADLAKDKEDGSAASRDDTGGGNETGKRIDEN